MGRKSLESGHWELTAPYILYNRPGIGYSSPIFKENFSVESSTLEERESALLGWLGATFDIEGTVGTILGAHSREEVEMNTWVYDVSNSSAPLLVYSGVNSSTSSVTQQSDLLVKKLEGSVGFPLNFSGASGSWGSGGAEQFELRCALKGSVSPLSKSYLQWLVAIIAIDLLLLGMVNGVFQRMAMVEKDCHRMEKMKDAMIEAKIAAESADEAKSEPLNPQFHPHVLLSFLVTIYAMYFVLVVLSGQFLATVSHEIRTPMNGVLGMLSLLGDTGLTRVQQDYVDTARASGQALISLINDVLDFSKVTLPL